MQETRPGEYIGRKELGEIFNSCGIPSSEIPALLDRCRAGSSWPDWQEIVNEWRVAHGLAGVVSKRRSTKPAGESLPETPADVLSLALIWQRILADIPGDSKVMPFVGRSIVRTCVHSIRAMGEVPPKLSADLPNIESVRQALDEIIAWPRNRKEPEGGKAITVSEANKIAMRLAKQDHTFVNGGVRKWAAAIRKVTGKTCSTTTVSNTALWKTTMTATGRGRSKSKTPKAVSLSDSMESVVGRGGRHGALQKLIAEQEADNEPSPLDTDTAGRHRRPRHFKRV